MLFSDEAPKQKPRLCQAAFSSSCENSRNEYGSGYGLRAYLETGQRSDVALALDVGLVSDGAFDIGLGDAVTVWEGAFRGSRP